MKLTVKDLIEKGISEDMAKLLIESVEDSKQLENELYETPEETEEINKKIADLQRDFPNQVEILSDGSILFSSNIIKSPRVRHKRKDYLSNMITRYKCISAIIKDWNSGLDEDISDYSPRPEYYQPILNSNNIVIRVVPRGQLKSKLDFGIEYDDAVRLIQMLNSCNPDKEFFLENY